MQPQQPQPQSQVNSQRDLLIESRAEPIEFSFYSLIWRWPCKTPFWPNPPWNSFWLKFFNLVLICFFFFWEQISRRSTIQSICRIQDSHSHRILGIQQMHRLHVAELVILEANKSIHVKPHINMRRRHSQRRRYTCIQWITICIRIHV